MKSVICIHQQPNNQRISFNIRICEISGDRYIQRRYWCEQSNCWIDIPGMAGLEAAFIALVDVMEEREPDFCRLRENNDVEFRNH